MHSRPGHDDNKAEVSSRKAQAEPGAYVRCGCADHNARKAGLCAENHPTHCILARLSHSSRRASLVDFLPKPPRTRAGANEKARRERESERTSRGETHRVWTMAPECVDDEDVVTVSEGKKGGGCKLRARPRGVSP